MARDAGSTAQILRALEEKGADTGGLSPVGVRPGLGEYLRQLWDRRHFIAMDSRHRLASKNSRNLLGNIWLVLRPILDAAIYFVIFGLVLDITRGVDNFAAYVVVGILMFRSSSRSMSSAPGIIRSGGAMIRAFSFPRASLVISSVIRDALQMRFTVVVMMVMIMALPPHELPGWTWLLVVPIFALHMLLNLGISLVLARLGYMIPDLEQVMSLVSRCFLYGSGVIFPIEEYFDHPALSAVIQANPIFQVLKMYRAILMDNALPQAHSWIILSAWAVGLVIVGFLFFWRGEASYGDGR